MEGGGVLGKITWHEKIFKNRAFFRQCCSNKGNGTELQVWVSGKCNTLSWGFGIGGGCAFVGELEMRGSKVVCTNVCCFVSFQTTRSKLFDWPEFFCTSETAFLGARANTGALTTKEFAVSKMTSQKLSSLATITEMFTFRVYFPHSVKVHRLRFWGQCVQEPYRKVRLSSVKTFSFSVSHAAKKFCLWWRRGGRRKAGWSASAWTLAPNAERWII